MHEKDPAQHLAPELLSPNHTPYHFTVKIREETERGFLALEVNGEWVHKTRGYSLEEREHTAYLSLYEKLSADFGLRLPQNRRETNVPPQRDYPYLVLLKQNLTPEILYGYGDPAVLRVDKGPHAEETTYYLVATSNDAPDSFPLLRSHTLTDWELVRFVFPRGQKPAWAAEGELLSDYWAPELHLVGGEFRLYFVARDKHTRELCIGLARSTSPEGPFRADPLPLLRDNVIDPHLFVQEEGTSFLFWKEDNNEVWPRLLLDLLYHSPYLISELFPQKEDQITASFILTIWPWAKTLEPMERFLVIQVFIEAVIYRYLEFYDQLTALLQHQSPNIQQEIQLVQRFMKTPIYAQQLSPDGSTLVGERTKVLENDLAWEAHLIEGIWVTQQMGKYYLFYAGNDFSTDQYGIGVAYADSLLGPYQKLSAPLLQSTADWWAPGHPSVVTGPDGKPQLILHAYFPHHAGYKKFRAVLAVPLTFEGEKVRLG